jgi:TRAP-type C4-dicarboxylate transport system permease small subunit
MNTPDTNEFPTETPAAAQIRNPIQKVANALAAVGTVWIFLIMLLIVADVLGRNFFNSPITGVSEFAARSVASIVFLQLGAAVGSGRMTRSDFVLQWLARRQPAWHTALEVANVVAGGLLFAALAWIAWPELTRAIDSSEFMGVQGVFTMVTWPFRALIVLGAAFAALCYFTCIPSLLRAGKSQERT